MKIVATLSVLKVGWFRTRVEKLVRQTEFKSGFLKAYVVKSYADGKNSGPAVEVSSHIDIGLLNDTTCTLTFEGYELDQVKKVHVEIQYTQEEILAFYAAFRSFPV